MGNATAVLCSWPMANKGWGATCVVVAGSAAGGAVVAGNAADDGLGRWAAADDTGLAWSPLQQPAGLSQHDVDQDIDQGT